MFLACKPDECVGALDFDITLLFYSAKQMFIHNIRRAIYNMVEVTNINMSLFLSLDILSKND